LDNIKATRGPSVFGAKSGTPVAASVGAVLAALALWFALHLVLNTPAVPSPIEAVIALGRDLPGELRIHAAFSVGRVLVSLTLAGTLGFAAGISLGRCRAMQELVGPLVFLTQPIPKVVFLPVFMVLFGLGELSKIALVGLIVFYQVTVTTWDAARSLKEEHLRSLRALGASPLALYMHAVIPGVLPSLFTSLRLGLGTAIAVLFIAETFATRWGLGFYLLDAWSRSAYPTLYAGIVVMGVLGWTLHSALGWLERVSCPWLFTDR